MLQIAYSVLKIVINNVNQCSVFISDKQSILSFFHKNICKRYLCITFRTNTILPDKLLAIWQVESKINKGRLMLYSFPVLLTDMRYPWIKTSLRSGSLSAMYGCGILHWISAIVLCTPFTDLISLFLKVMFEVIYEKRKHVESFCIYIFNILVCDNTTNRLVSV